MIVIDENIVESQRQQLLRRRLRVRQIGFEVGQKGMDDREQIVPLLHRLNRVTFFTRDADFYDRALGHQRYCLVVLAVPKDEAADLIVRTLRHPNFDPQGKRTGRCCASRTAAFALGVQRRHWSRCCPGPTDPHA